MGCASCSGGGGGSAGADIVLKDTGVRAMDDFIR